MNNPYKHINDNQFWRKSISGVEPFKTDPVSDVKFKILKEDKVATAGSCFAQHISRELSKIGFNYFVTETGILLPESERLLKNYSVFSARFGNIYTTRQLLQLFDESFGFRKRSQIAWQRNDKKYVDPLRPNIEPEGFGTIDLLVESRLEHLGFVREMFQNMDIFVFTLGLTETWRELSSGEVYPIAPGVVAGNYLDSIYGFYNFNVSEVIEDLNIFLMKLRDVNPKVKVLLTVSPVPLIATYENRHVLVSTTYSKSVLRVAAENVMQHHDWIDYFPSYEIISGNFSRGRYYESDLREVNSAGVSHVMRCFLKHYTDSPVHTQRMLLTDSDDYLKCNSVICDEEAISRINI